MVLVLVQTWEEILEVKIVSNKLNVFTYCNAKFWKVLVGFERFLYIFG